MYTVIYMNYPVNENGRNIGNTSFADLIAEAQFVTDIDTNIATLTASLSTLSASSLSETNRAKASENSISAFISAEASRAAFAETGIKALVVVETARAKAAEVALTTAITALQVAPPTSLSIQDFLMTSWFFGTGSFGSQYVQDGSSLNINIRVYRVGNQVTLTLYAGRAAANGGYQAIYCDFLPDWGRPTGDTVLPLMIFTSNIMSPGYLFISASGSIRMELTWNQFEGQAGLAYNACVTYLV